MLVNKTQADHVLARINEIAAALAAKGPDQQEPNLGEGAAGIALFFAYLHVAAEDPGNNLLLPDLPFQDLAFDFLNTATTALAEQPMPPSLFSGFTGIVWSAQHITGLLSHSSDDLCADVDAALETYLNHSPWTHDYDLIMGLVGIGVYCLQRSNSSAARRCLELIVERLAELAESAEGGLRWFTPPDHLPDHQREMYPHGYYNLGLAHGVPGIIALLAKTHAAGIQRERSRHLLDGAVNWLLRQRLAANFRSSFSAFFVPDLDAVDCRLAWCYGDAGISAALLVAASSTANPFWEKEALAIARRAALREPQTCGVVDACFCHGSAGLMHAFNRLYHATHEDVFAQAARYWLEWTLEFRKPGSGAADYAVRRSGADGQMEFQPRFGMLEGIAGIGLALLASVASVDPAWDSVFMLDIPPASVAQ